MESLATRIDRLERRNRHLTLIGVLLALTMCTGLIMGQAAPTAKPIPDIVMARSFYVIDENGKSRAALRYDKEKDSVELLLGDGKDWTVHMYS